MKNVWIGLLLAACAAVAGCADLAGLAGYQGAAGTQSKSALTQAEIVAGLKEALKVGTNKASQQLSATNGYYGDLAVRILLPDEAQVITRNISKLPGGQTMVDNVVRGINAAASDAASETAPIFIDAITSMTIQDGAKILAGGNTAATAYFKQKTRPQLKKLFASKIDASLQKKIVGNVSAQSSWNTMTTQWNNVAGSVVGQVAGLTTVQTDLSDYLTDKALDGLFTKVGEQETAIRTKASARTSAILQKVFGR